MSMILARVLNVPDGPKLPPGTSRHVKDFLLMIHVQDWLFWALLAGVAILLFRFLGGIGKLIMIGVGAVMLYGWAGDGGFVKLANLLSSDAGMWTAMIVGGGLAIMKFRNAPRGHVPSLRRGRRGR